MMFHSPGHKELEGITELCAIREFHAYDEFLEIDAEGLSNLLEEPPF